MLQRSLGYGGGGDSMTQLVFIHGVNDQTTGYSNRLFGEIVRAYVAGLIEQGASKADAQARAKQLVQKEILWADVTTDLTNRYLSLQYALKGRSGKWNAILRPIDPLVLQILYYVKDKGHKRGPMAILKEVDEAFRRACADRSEQVVVIAHSLGSVIAYDYLFGFRKHRVPPGVTVKALITLGSPIPLFTAAMGFVDNPVELPKNVERWVNVLDPDDGVARFCEPYFKSGIVRDVTVNTGFAPLGAHNGYWRSRAVASLLAEQLAELGV